MAKSGPAGRLMPDVAGAVLFEEFSEEDCLLVESFWDQRIPEEIWKRLNEIYQSQNLSLDDRIPLAEWKTINAAIRRRFEGADVSFRFSRKEKKVFDLAWALHGGQDVSPLSAILGMQNEISADEKRYRSLKANNKLYQRDARGEPLHAFIWIEYIHTQTEAIIAFHDIFHEIGFDTSLTFARVPEISFLDEIMPTPFEKFCFEFVFKVPLEDVLAASQGDESTNASHAHFQRIRSALAYRASKF